MAFSSVPIEMKNEHKNILQLNTKSVGEFHSTSSMQNKLASCKRGLFIFAIMFLMLQSFTYGRPTSDDISLGSLDVDTGNKIAKNFNTYF